ARVAGGGIMSRATVAFDPSGASRHLPDDGGGKQIYFRASWIARQTRCGVAGICRRRTPTGQSASMIAFMTVGVEPTVPDSPTPLTPSGLPFAGTESSSVLEKVGKVSARGMA